MSQAATENPVSNPAVMPGLNGGTLRRGGTNKGGPGRTPDRIRKIARQELSKRVRLLGFFADGLAVSIIETSDETDPSGKKTKQKHVLHSPQVTDRIRALEALHKIGMGETVSVSEVRERLKATMRCVHAADLPPEVKTDLIDQIVEVWK